MAPPATSAPPNWAADLPPEVWALVAKRRGVVGAWQLMGVNRATRAGAKEFLSTLPGLVVCGGRSHERGERVSDVLRLDLATMRWEPMPALLTVRSHHACCAVRGTLVVLGGLTSAGGDGRGRPLSSVEMLSSSEEGGAFVDLPPLSRGVIYGAAAIAVEESDSAAGQVLLLGGADEGFRTMSPLSTVQLVDLATGACAPQNNLLHQRVFPAVGRLPDGRVVCAGGVDGEQSVEVLEPPEQGAADTAWTWRELPPMIAERWGCRGCVMSDGRFAVLGGWSFATLAPMSSCEALVVDVDVQWEYMPPMHDARNFFECGAVAGCVIVAGGEGCKTAEVYDEELNRWLRLPCDLPTKRVRIVRRAVAVVAATTLDIVIVVATLRIAARFVRRLLRR
jgi:hypothetical protein